MIHSAYFHGDEQPATELSPRQIQAARRDPASALWIDLDRPIASESDRLLAALGGSPAWAALRELPPSSRAAAPGGGHGQAPTVEVWLEGPMVVTRHAHASELLRRFAARLQPRGGTLADGVRTLLADLAEAAADGYEAALPAPDAAGDERRVAQRTAEVEHAAEHAAATFRALAERAPRRGGAAGDALDVAVRRLEALAASAGEDADAAQGAAATAGLAEAVAIATRQLRLLQTIMPAGLALLAVIAYLLWQIAGSLR